MSEQTYTILPLEWNGRSCHTIFGSYTITREWTLTEADDASEGNGAWRWEYCFDEYRDEGSSECGSIEDGKQKAEQHYRERLLRALALTEKTR